MKVYLGLSCPQTKEARSPSRSGHNFTAETFANLHSFPRNPRAFHPWCRLRWRQVLRRLHSPRFCKQRRQRRFGEPGSNPGLKKHQEIQRRVAYTALRLDATAFIPFPVVTSHPSFLLSQHHPSGASASRARFLQKEQMNKPPPRGGPADSKSRLERGPQGAHSSSRVHFFFSFLRLD